MKHHDAVLHVKGVSLFADDFKLPQNLLYAAVLVSPVSHGAIEKLETAEALSMPGVERIITAKDIPGKNQIGSIIKDELLLAEKELCFIGQPVVLVLADRPERARAAVKAIRLETGKLPSVVDPREAFEKGMLIAPPRTFSMGNTAEAWDGCDCIVSGRADSGGQEHLYLETQGAFALPLENGCIRITSATQGPTFVQRVAARVLKLPMNKIEVDVGRLGGAFGGKEDQATPWAVMSALGVQLTGKPVKLV
ncbi:MAG: molybdopterin cofactor-binding domain-containing protein, partial [Candidatus Fermentibacteria bacterium]